MATSSFAYALRQARRRDRGASHVLTTSELRVARMAALGMKNREIAATQFVTVKAVEFHLANAYRKLEITSRAELGAALSQRAA